MYKYKIKKDFDSEIKLLQNSYPLLYPAAIAAAQYAFIHNTEQDWLFYEQDSGRKRPYWIHKNTLQITSNQRRADHFIYWYIQEFCRGGNNG